MAYGSSAYDGPNLSGEHDISGNDVLRTPRDGLDVNAHTSNAPKLHSRWNVEPVVYIQVEGILFVVPREAFKEFGSAKAIDAISNLDTVKSSKDASTLLRIGKVNGLEGLMRTSAIHLICDTTLGMKELSEAPYALEWEIIARILQARLKGPTAFVTVFKARKGSSSERISKCPHCQSSYFAGPTADLEICSHAAEIGFNASFLGMSDEDNMAEYNEGIGFGW